MIRLYYWPTPNSHKITMMLEEAGMDFEILPLDIARGDQFQLDYLRVAPNNKMPAIVDAKPIGGGDELSIFESAAILIYLAEKCGKFLPRETNQRFEVLQWLIWQAAGLGPMAGQSNHFNRYAPERLSYAIKRYKDETSRLYRVLDNHLIGRQFIGDEYSIADMAIYPWAELHKLLEQEIEQFPHVARWLEAVKSRPATRRAYAMAEGFHPVVMDEATRGILLGQNAATLKRE